MKVLELTEETRVVVGGWYEVPCVNMLVDGRELVHLPVIGTRHVDKQFGVDFEHYHIDGRFFDRRAHGQYYDVDKNGYTNGIIPVDGFEYWHKGRGFKMDFCGQTKYTLRCKRLRTGVKPPPEAAKYFAWYAGFVGKKCKGKRCPHFGTVMHEMDGRLVCPLHNLQADAVTETIIEPVSPLWLVEGCEHN